MEEFAKTIYFWGGYPTKEIKSYRENKVYLGLRCNRSIFRGKKAGGSGVGQLGKLKVRCIYFYIVRYNVE